MKKFKKLFFILIIINIIFATVVFADDIDKETIDVKEIIEVSSKIIDEIKLGSREVVVMERTTGIILYEKNGDNKMPMASTTKVLTAIVVLERANLNEVITVSKKAAGTGGSRLGLRTGDKVTINNLMHGLMLCSGNDAAVALAEAVGGSVERFCRAYECESSGVRVNKFTFFYPSWAR